MAKKTKNKPTASSARPGKNGSAAHRSAPALAPKRSSTIEKKPNGVMLSATARQITSDDIARAAYLRWQKFGGDPETNWLAAERDLRAAVTRH